MTPKGPFQPKAFFDSVIAHPQGLENIPGNIQGQVGWGSEQPDPPEDAPTHCRGVGPR